MGKGKLDKAKSAALSIIDDGLKLRGREIKKIVNDHDILSVAATMKLSALL